MESIDTASEVYQSYQVFRKRHRDQSQWAVGSHSRKEGWKRLYQYISWQFLYIITRMISTKHALNLANTLNCRASKQIQWI
jgi:hypothetical protein